MARTSGCQHPPTPGPLSFALAQLLRVRSEQHDLCDHLFPVFLLSRNGRLASRFYPLQSLLDRAQPQPLAGSNLRLHIHFLVHLECAFPSLDGKGNCPLGRIDGLDFFAVGLGPNRRGTPDKNADGTKCFLPHGTNCLRSMTRRTAWAYLINHRHRQRFCLRWRRLLPRARAGGYTSLMLRGVPISPGVAVARAFRLDPALARHSPNLVDAAALSAEVSRFDQACDAVAVELDQTIERVRGEVGEDSADIFRGHRAILRDPAFVAKVKGFILTDQLDAASSLNKTLEEYDILDRKSVV